MDSFHNLLLGLSVALQPLNLFYCFIGCVAGTLVGVLPGVGPAAAVALLLPSTFHLDPISAIVKELGIPCTPQKIVQAREAAEKMLREEKTITVRAHKYVTEAEFDAIIRKIG